MPYQGGCRFFASSRGTQSADIIHHLTKAGRGLHNNSLIVSAIAYESFYAGRSEIKIRRVEVPVTLCDFQSCYATVNALLNNWQILTAASLEFQECTQEVQQRLQELTINKLFDQRTWPQLRFFAKVRPQGDVLPVRARYDVESQNIAFNHFSASESYAYAGPALAAATILSGKIPEIEYAMKLAPRGTQSGLKPVKLRGEIEIDPSHQDFFRFVTEERVRLKESHPILAEFLKVLANGGAYGLFAQMNPMTLQAPLPIKVFTSTDSFICQTKDIDESARWTFMPLAALVTAGSHLLLALAEKLVHDAGGEYAFMDTDSICVVSNRDGGLVSCPEGAHKVSDGREAIRAFSWSEVDEKIVKPFASLNPFSGKTGEDSILKIEKSKYLKSENGSRQRRQLWGYCISAKRYCLSEYVNHTRRIVKASAHGWGFLQPPYTAKDRIEDEFHPWFSEAWDWLLASQLDGETAAQGKRKPWFDYVALMPLNITTPHVIRRFRNFPGFSPMNFLSCPQVVNVPKAGKAGIPPAFFMPYTEPKDAEGKDCWDQFGNRHHLPPESEIERHLDTQGNLVPKLYAAFIRDHIQRPEAKFLGPDGLQCGGDTRGLLSRMHVEAAEKIPIRKESNRRWTQGEDVTLLTSYAETDATATPYEPLRKQQASSDLRNWLALRTITKTSSDTKIDRETISRVIRGKSVKQRTLVLLERYRKIQTIVQRKND